MKLFDFFNRKPKPLVDAILSENLNDVKKHIKIGTDLNGVLGTKPPIFYAHNRSIFELLLKNGVKVNVCNEKGETPLHRAASDGYFGKVKLLIEYGADVNAKDNTGRTPISVAKTEDIVNFLKTKGAKSPEQDVRPVSYNKDKWLSDAKSGKKNLSGADLSGADLREVDLSGADLSGANLSNANLQLADLSGANLTEANLSKANLREANLTAADLTGADFKYADLRDSMLLGAVLLATDFGGANLNGAYGKW